LPRPHPPSIPLCPRCAYDQSGAIATWEDTCPLEGICPECGLTFAWTNVFHPERSQLRGFVEHAQSPVQFALWSIRTCWWAMLPNRYWCRATLERQPRPWRWAFALLTLFAALQLFAAVARILALWLDRPNADRSEYTFAALVPFFRVDSVVSNPWAAYERGTFVLGGLVFTPLFHQYPPALLLTLLVPLLLAGLLMMLPFTRAVAKVRAAHVARAAIGAYAPLLIWFVLMAVDAVARYDVYFSPLRAVGDIAVWISEAAWGHWVWFAALAIAWQAWWWYSALSTGYRIKNAAFVVLLLGTAAVLATATIAVLVLGRELVSRLM
jgi:hypothetical protein